MTLYRKIKSIPSKLVRLYEDFCSYPDFLASDEDYNIYWSSRRLLADTLNNFQKDRAKLLESNVDTGVSVMDIGCGNGEILARVNTRKKFSRMYGVELSEAAIKFLSDKGVTAIKGDINDGGLRTSLPVVDCILLFEVLEHMPNSEDILEWALGKCKKKVFFSVPNTGYFKHRLRLLLGRFPLQWRVRPSEHVRFWTLADMKWWLSSLGYKNAKIICYQGIPILNRVWPSLFSAGIFVGIETSR